MHLAVTKCELCHSSCTSLLFDKQSKDVFFLCFLDHFHISASMDSNYTYGIKIKSLRRKYMRSGLAISVVVIICLPKMLILQLCSEITVINTMIGTIDSELCKSNMLITCNNIMMRQM